MLANSLWFHYHKSSNWAWSIWDNTFAALRVQVNPEASRDTRYATFLLHVDQHLPGGLDEHVARWFQETGKAELISIDSVCLDEPHTHAPPSRRARCAGDNYNHEGPGLSSMEPRSHLRKRQTARYIFAPPTTSSPASYYLMKDPGSDMVELQRVRARRQDVFCAPHLSLLVGSIPTLVFLEHAQHVPVDLRPRAAALRDAVCGSVEFRQGIYRDLNAVRDAFDKSLQYDSLDECLVEPLMDALRLILNVARTGMVLLRTKSGNPTNEMRQIRRL
jgi:mediator of RNA polymerase II transcription subunit 12